MKERYSRAAFLMLAFSLLLEPVSLAAAIAAPDKSTALRLEILVKKAPAKQKIELLKALGGQYNLSKELQ